MVLALGIGCNDYWSAFLPSGEMPVLACPDCALELRGHGWHHRYIDCVDAALRRVRCHFCCVTHVVLPIDLCAYRDAKLSLVEAALAVGEEHLTEATRSANKVPDACPRALLASGLGSAVRRVRRWFLGIRFSVKQQVESLLPALYGTLLQRVQQVFGAAPNALVRLRTWLWEIHRFLFLGPTGLWRHGRRPKSIRCSATDFGYLTRAPNSS